MRAFFTRTSVKFSIRDLNMISYIHIIVIWISDSDDLTKVSSGAMGYRSGMGGDEEDRRGEDDEEWNADPIFVFEPCICVIQLSHERCLHDLLN